MIKKFWELYNTKVYDEIGLTYFSCKIGNDFNKTKELFIKSKLIDLGYNNKLSGYVRSERKERKFVRSSDYRQIKKSVIEDIQIRKKEKQKEINNLLNRKINEKDSLFLELSFLKNQIINDPKIDKFDKMEVETVFNPTFVSNFIYLQYNWDLYCKQINNIDNNIDVIENFPKISKANWERIVKFIGDIINPNQKVDVDEKTKPTNSAWIMPTNSNEIGIGDC